MDQSQKVQVSIKKCPRDNHPGALFIWTVAGLIWISEALVCQFNPGPTFPNPGSSTARPDRSYAIICPSSVPGSGHLPAGRSQYSCTLPSWAPHTDDQTQHTEILREFP